MSLPPKHRALEFFAGGGLARLGLAGQFDVVWANDIDPRKGEAWRANFGEAGFVLGNVHDVDPKTVPIADLAWASFPCQDLSLAGGRAGLGAPRSSAFYGFVDIIKSLQSIGHAPQVLVIENVSGLLTSHGGQDFAALMRVLSELGYCVGAMEIDARHFLPQSRPRVFIVACIQTMAIPKGLIARGPVSMPFASTAIIKAWQALPQDLKDQHIWWHMSAPHKTTHVLADIIDPTDQNWWPQSKVDVLVKSLSARHLKKIIEIQSTNTCKIGAIYRRTRRKDGVSRPYAEVRFDGLAGCLRTPSGGSSRQFLMFVQGDTIRVRPLNSREAMRLMGVPESYILPARALAGLKIAGDGVAVPVVAWLSEHVLGTLVGGDVPKVI